MELIISGIILMLVGAVLCVITIVKHQKESFVKSLLSGIFLAIGMLLILFKIGDNIENIDDVDTIAINQQVEYFMNEII